MYSVCPESRSLCSPFGFSDPAITHCPYCRTALISKQDFDSLYPTSSIDWARENQKRMTRVFPPEMRAQRVQDLQCMRSDPGWQQLSEDEQHERRWQTVEREHAKKRLAYLTEILPEEVDKPRRSLEQIQLTIQRIEQQILNMQSALVQTQQPDLQAQIDLLQRELRKLRRQEVIHGAGRLRFAAGLKD